MEEKGNYNPEEEVVTGNWNTPKISLKEVEVKTGEEDETLFWSGRSKLYRWVNGEWKERGLGESKLLKHKEKGTIRFLLRQEKTLKIVANHYIYPTESYCKLVPNAGSEKIYAWTVKDFAEEPKIEQFALKFNTADAAKIFKQKFDEAGENNKKLMNLVNEKKEGKEEDKTDSNDKDKNSDKDKNKDKDSEKDIDTKKETDTKTNTETETDTDTDTDSDTEKGKEKKKEETDKTDKDDDKEKEAKNKNKQEKVGEKDKTENEKKKEIDETEEKEERNKEECKDLKKEENKEKETNNDEKKKMKDEVKHNIDSEKNKISEENLKREDE